MIKYVISWELGWIRGVPGSALTAEFSKFPSCPGSPRNATLIVFGWRVLLLHSATGALSFSSL